MRSTITRAHVVEFVLLSMVEEGGVEAFSMRGGGRQNIKRIALYPNIRSCLVRLRIYRVLSFGPPFWHTTCWVAWLPVVPLSGEIISHFSFQRHFLSRSSVLVTIFCEVGGQRSPQHVCLDIVWSTVAQTYPPPNLYPIVRKLF